MRSDSDKAARFLRHLEPLRGGLEAYCRKNVNDPGAVEDVLQSAVANAFRDFHLYVENTNFRAWMFKYTNLEILNWNRRKRPRLAEERPAEVARPVPWEAAVNERLWEDLRERPDSVLDYCDDELAHALSELPDLDRSVLLLRAIGDFKYREIGEILDIPVGSVMGYLGRARVQLRHRLVEYCRQRGFLRRA